MRVSKLSQSILDFIAQNPDKTSNEIATAVSCGLNSAKASLWKLHKAGKIVREKKLNEVKKPGALSQYVYKVSA